MATILAVTIPMWVWNTFWHVLAASLVLVCLLMIVIILIQDSKGAGLTSAFGAGPGGESLLGARMQKDIARWTAILGIIFAVIVILMGLIGNHRLKYGSAAGAGAKPAEPAAEAPAGADAPKAPVEGGPVSPLDLLPKAGGAGGAPGQPDGSTKPASK